VSRESDGDDYFRGGNRSRGGAAVYQISPQRPWQPKLKAAVRSFHQSVDEAAFLETAARANSERAASGEVQTDE
jgi:hypothetical protein